MAKEGYKEIVVDDRDVMRGRKMEAEINHINRDALLQIQPYQKAFNMILDDYIEEGFEFHGYNAQKKILTVKVAGFKEPVTQPEAPQKPSDKIPEKNQVVEK